MSRLVLLFSAFSFINSCNGQDSSDKKVIHWNIFLETYYCFDFNSPSDHQRPSFIYNHKRHNEFNINLALAKFGYETKSLRASFGLMAGTYAENNLATEPTLLKHIYEGNIGLRLSGKKDIWIDAGILSSHIGFESAVSKDCWTLTRSLAAENSPYYETGMKLSYSTDNKKWFLSSLVLNGWQRIRRPEANNSLAIGTQVTYKSSDRFSVNSSIFIGNDKPDSLRKWRYFHDLFTFLKISESLALTAGFDFGIEQKAKNSSQYNSWYSPILILRYQKNNWAVAARAEYYSDKNGVIVSLVNNRPFQMQGYSLNIDKIIGEKSVFRMEGRYFTNSTAYFLREGDFVYDDMMITASLIFDLRSTTK